MPPHSAETCYSDMHVSSQDAFAGDDRRSRRGLKAASAPTPLDRAGLDQLTRNRQTHMCVSRHRGDVGMVAAKKNKGTVGVIGLGIMGGAFAKNLAAAGWRVIGYDISAARRREAQRAGVEIATQRRRRRRRSADHPHQPAQAAGPDGHRARNRRRQAQAQADRGNEHLRNFRQGKSRARAAQGRPCDARLPGQRHRLAGQDPRPGVLRQRRQGQRSSGSSRCSRPSAAASTTSAPSAMAAR